MEQAATLTMSDKTQPPTREATPTPDKTIATTDTAGEAGPSGTGTSDGTAATAGPAAPADNAPLTQRLYTGNFEEEVGQVMKGLGSFWGGFKARSALTLATLKTDVEKTVAQVQTDLKQLQDTKVEVQTKDKETWEREQAEEKERVRVREEEEKERKEAEKLAKVKGKGKAREGEGDDHEDDEGTGAQATATALFNRISSSTTQLQGSIQSALASTLAAAKANPAVTSTAQMRAQLAENLRLQTARENITLSVHQAEKLAGEYLKKGEGFLKEAERVGGNLMKDAEKWVEENVKIVPPQDGDFVPSTGWETGEWYSFSTVSPSASTSTIEQSTPRASTSTAVLAGSRKEALLRRLREDKDLLMVDPASDAETQERRDEFASWVATKWPAAQSAGRESEEGHVGGIRMALVPEHLTDEQFWQRYLFHKDMIEAADAKRKLLLQASEQETAEDFSWDDDDEPEASAKTDGNETSTPTQVVPTPVAPKPAEAAPAPAPAKDAPATSPRDSEESYDVVSGRASTAAPTEDDDDSDWE